MPKTMIMLAPAMRIIGFLRRLRGETVLVVSIAAPRSSMSMDTLTSALLNKIFLATRGLNLESPDTDCYLFNRNDLSLI
jgi:hypothetical protein